MTVTAISAISAISPLTIAALPETPTHLSSGREGEDPATTPLIAGGRFSLLRLATLTVTMAMKVTSGVLETTIKSVIGTVLAGTAGTDLRRAMFPLG